MSRARERREAREAEEKTIAALAEFSWVPALRPGPIGWMICLPRGDRDAEGSIGSGSTPENAWLDAWARIQITGVPKLRELAGFHKP